MKKDKVLHYIGVIIGVLILPVTLPISFLFLVTRGKYNKEQCDKFTQNFIKQFQEEIYSFLKIKSLPEIYINSYMEKNVLGEFIKPGIIDISRIFDMDKFIINRTDNTDTYIPLYYNNMMNVSYGHKLFIKITMIKTIIHELTHYKQFIEERFEANHSSTFEDYEKEPCEVEARKSSKRFTLKHLLKIIRFLIHN